MRGLKFAHEKPCQQKDSYSGKYRANSNNVPIIGCSSFISQSKSMPRQDSCQLVRLDKKKAHPPGRAKEAKQRPAPATYAPVRCPFLTLWDISDEPGTNQLSNYVMHDRPQQLLELSVIRVEPHTRIRPHRCQCIHIKAQHLIDFRF